MINLLIYRILITSSSRWPHSNYLYASVRSKFVYVLDTIFIFMVTYYIQLVFVLSLLIDCNVIITPTLVSHFTTYYDCAYKELFLFEF